MKKLVSLFLALAMMLSMASFAAAEEPFTITVMLPDMNALVDAQQENNPVLEAIEAAKRAGHGAAVAFLLDAHATKFGGPRVTGRPNLAL